LDVDESYGLFDYIIAHGVYSWVPQDVREKIFSICHHNLAPNGVAFVSYNTYPGCHIRTMVREMMLFHVQGVNEPSEQINQATALVKFLAESQTNPDLYRMMLKDELEQISKREENYLYHDDLATTNDPCYFYQFIDRATRSKLQYLAEADYFEMTDRIYTPAVSSTLKQLASNRIVREQYLDFLKCRRFRQTLLCHHNIRLQAPPNPEVLRRLYISSTARPSSSDVILHDRSTVKFTGKKGAAMETDFSLAKAAFQILGDIWPHCLSFEELLSKVCTIISPANRNPIQPTEEEQQTLCSILLATYSMGLTELRTYRPPVNTNVSSRPVASPLTRYQIQRDGVVTNQYHSSVVVEDEIGKKLLQLLDGTRDRTLLLQELAAHVTAISVTTNTEPRSVENIKKSLSKDLDENLDKLAKMGLLIS